MINRESLFNEAYNYLLDLIEKEVLLKELNYYKENSISDLNEVYKRLLISLQNRQGFMNFLGSVDGLRAALFKYDAKRVIAEYGDDHLELMHKIKPLFPNKIFSAHNKRNAWYQYSKSILSAAKFLSQFHVHADFEEFIEAFDINPQTRAALPMVLSYEIHGLGYALSCDFLKEIGYSAYGKPDIWLRRIFVGVGLVPPTASDFMIAKEISLIADEVGRPAAEVDKVFWIIGSGKLNQSNGNIGSHYDNFINKVTTTSADKT